MLGEENGLELLDELLLLHKDLPVIMITGFGSIDTAVQAMKRGAYDYATKPGDWNKLKIVVKNAMTVRSLRKEVSKLSSLVSAIFILVSPSDKNEPRLLHGDLDRQCSIRLENSTNNPAIHRHHGEY